MSDQRQPENFEGQSVTAENSVFHSGKLPEEMAERPVNEFDNTPLEQAHERNLISPLPEHPGALTDQDDKKSLRTSLLMGGGAIALVAVGIGYMLGQDRDSSPQQNQERIIFEDVILDSDDSNSTTDTMAQNNQTEKPIDLVNEFEDIQRTIYFYDELEIKPVTDPQPEVYIRELNYQIAIASMDQSEARSEEAIEELTGGRPESSRLTNFLRERRLENIESQGFMYTFVSEPGTIEVIRSGSDYAVIRTTNVNLYVTSSGEAYPQRDDRTIAEGYYYVSIEQNGRKRLLGAHDTLTNWQGKGDLGF